MFFAKIRTSLSDKGLCVIKKEAVASTSLILPCHSVTDSLPSGQIVKRYAQSIRDLQIREHTVRRPEQCCTVQPDRNSERERARPIPVPGLAAEGGARPVRHRQRLGRIPPAPIRAGLLQSLTTYLPSNGRAAFRGLVLFLFDAYPDYIVRSVN